MKVEFKKSFLKEIQNLRNQKLKDSVFNAIINVEESNNISGIKNLKSLTGFREFYRIRIGEYRIGLKIESEVVYFVTIEH
jgi:mRNA interferase RelE/StbE